MEMDAWEEHLEQTFGPSEAPLGLDAPQNTLGDRLAKDKTEETEEDRKARKRPPLLPHDPQ
eukprot:541682-Prorocentrum_lima.AAC.1